MREIDCGWIEDTFSLHFLPRRCVFKMLQMGSIFILTTKTLSFFLSFSLTHSEMDCPQRYRDTEENLSDENISFRSTSCSIDTGTGGRSRELTIQTSRNASLPHSWATMLTRGWDLWSRWTQEGRRGEVCARSETRDTRSHAWDCLKSQRPTSVI